MDKRIILKTAMLIIAAAALSAIIFLRFAALPAHLAASREMPGSPAVSPSPPPSAESSAEAAAPEERPEPLPEPKAEPTPEPQSIIITVEYTTHDYDRSETEPVVKPMSVYLPRGYDPEAKYDAAFLMHVLGQDETFWPGLGIKEVLDELISSGDCAPLVVFMPDGYVNDQARGVTGLGVYYPQFARELREDIFPFIQENFALYDSPEHYAFCGASFGAYMTTNSVLVPNLDLVANFGYIGGGAIYPSLLAAGWAEAGCEDCVIRYLYIGEGEFDDRGPVEESYAALLASCSKINKDNIVLSIIPGVGHDETEWITGVREALALFF